MTLTPQQRNESIEISQLDPASQAERIRFLLSTGLDGEMAWHLMRNIRSRGRVQVFSELSRTQSAWVNSTNWVSENYSWRMRKLLGMQTGDMESPPRFAGLRDRIIRAADGFEAPYVRALQRSRALDSAHMAELYVALGPDADVFARAARERFVETIAPHTGAMEKRSTSREQVERFERIQGDADFPIVEAGIMPLVAAMNAWGITTTQSCEGHADRGTPAPWVMFEPADEGRMQRLLNETGEKDWTIRLGGGFAAMYLKGSARDQTELTPGEREHLPQYLERARASAADLAARIDGLSVQLEPAVKLSGVDEAGSMDDLGIDDAAPDLSR